MEREKKFRNEAPIPGAASSRGKLKHEPHKKINIDADKGGGVEEKLYNEK